MTAPDTHKRFGVTAPDAHERFGVTAPDAHERFGRSFRSVLASVRRLKGRETHRPNELSYAQYSLLFHLAEVQGASTRELACLEHLSPATATQMLDGLERAGLVERVRSEGDRRVVVSSLTERGRALVEQRRAQIEGRWRTALEGFSGEQLLTAAAILDRIRELFDELADQPSAGHRAQTQVPARTVRQPSARTAQLSAATPPDAARRSSPRAPQSGHRAHRSSPSRAAGSAS